jgi:hypothetical protein
MPIGIVYFVMATSGLAIGIGLIAGPVLEVFRRFGAFGSWPHLTLEPSWLTSPIGFVFCVAAGVLILTVTLHVARGVGRLHARFAKALLVTPGS